MAGLELPPEARSSMGSETMAAFIISEQAESSLYEADRALAALETVFAALGEAQLECRCDELAALISLVRRPLAAARETARFDALAG